MAQPSAAEVAAALVIQNYDACFLAADAGAPDDVDLLRLSALAAVNVGDSDEAAARLARAESLAIRAGQRAHLCYLQGLIDTKRRYELAASDAHFHRGLATLRAAFGNGDDLALEQSWLLNGLALNNAIEFRRDRTRLDKHKAAVELIHGAFGLVKEGADPARTYLRFNLIANAAFLLEMVGQFDDAIRLFSRTFDYNTDSDRAGASGWTRTVAYRVGVLHYRARNLEDARRLLAEAAAAGAEENGWAVQERILHASGAIAIDSGNFDEAAKMFGEGLELSLAACAGRRAQLHGEGLFAALGFSGRHGEAERLRSSLREEHALVLRDGAGTWRAPVSPKLPAYVPEVDLEESPSVDLNLYLGTPQQSAATVGPRGRG